MTVQRMHASLLSARERRSFFTALFAIGAMILCGFLMHAAGHSQHQSTPASAATAHHGANPDGIAVMSVDGHDSTTSSLQVGGAPGQDATCGAGCGFDAAQVACMLALLTAALLIFVVRLQTKSLDLRGDRPTVAAAIRAGPRPMTPSLQELSISRI